MEVMKSKVFVEKAIDIAKNYKTLYIMGCFGAPMTEKNKARYTKNNSYNKKASRAALIRAASEDTFGFDCVCLIKAILWGWEGDTGKRYGGAKYKANGVPDINADAMMRKCKDVSTDFSKILPGEAVWLKGHIGIYIGDGLAVECTAKWMNRVQITTVNNIGTKWGYVGRSWTKHGKLPWVDYSDQEGEEVIYRVYAGGKWLPEVKGESDYAGVLGDEISGIQVKLASGKTVTVRSHIKGKARAKWLAPVTKWGKLSNGYSGIKGKATDCIAMKAEGCVLKYRVHVLGEGWLPWVTGYDISDYDKGLAGIYGKSIDAVQITVEK